MVYKKERKKIIAKKNHNFKQKIQKEKMKMVVKIFKMEIVENGSNVDQYWLQLEIILIHRKFMNIINDLITSLIFIQFNNIKWFKDYIVRI